MPTFDKSKKYENNYFVKKDEDTIYFNKAEMKELKSKLAAAVDSSTGYGTFKCSPPNNVKPSQIQANNSGVEMDNGIGGRVKLDYAEARDILKQMGEVILKEAVIDTKLTEMERE